MGKDIAIPHPALRATFPSGEGIITSERNFTNESNLPN